MSTQKNEEALKNKFTASIFKFRIKALFPYLFLIGINMDGSFSISKRFRTLRG